jgi:periplasmic protein TonB
MLRRDILCTGDVHSEERRRQPIVLPPRISEERDLLAGAILDAVTTQKRPLDLLVSLTVHVAVLSILLLVPLYFTAGLDLRRSVTTFLVAPIPPSAAPPPPPMPVARAPRTAPKQIVQAGQLMTPTFVPKKVAYAADDAPPPDQQWAGGVVGGMSGEMGGAPIATLLNVGVSNDPAPPKPTTFEPKRPIRLGSSMKPPQLIFSPLPEYPVLAKEAHIAGTVVIEAIIDEHGNVIEARAISGHPVLVQAALKAVSRRRYEPTILDGEPIPIELTIEVSFHG